MESERFLNLNDRAFGQAQDPQGEASVELGQLLHRRIGRGPGLESLQRTLVILLAIPHEADVVPQVFQFGLRFEDRFEERLGIVVLLQSEISYAELETDDQVVG